MGRPPKAKADRKSKTVRFRLSSAEYRKLEALSRAEGLSVSEYLRKRGGLTP